MALFIEVREYPKKGVIRYVFLKEKYSKEELNNLYDAFVKAGETIEKKCIDKLILMESGKCILKLRHEAVLITEECEAESHYHAKDKIIIYSDGTWSVEPHLNFLAKVRRIWDAWREDWAKPR